MRALLGLALILAGCAATAPSTQVEPSGWLDDYSQLTPNQPGLLIHLAADAELSRFRGLYVAPVETFPLAPPESDAARFARYLEQHVQATLPTRLAVVDAPGAGVAELRYAVTEFDREAVASQSGFRRGRAGVEVQLLDPDGRRLAAAVSRRLGGQSVWLHEATPDDARAIADRWVEALATQLREQGFPAPAN